MNEQEALLAALDEVRFCPTCGYRMTKLPNTTIMACIQNAKHGQFVISWVPAQRIYHVGYVGAQKRS